MQISEIHIVFMLCNVIATYVICKLIKFFLGNEVKNDRIEMVLCLIYYILSSFCYFFIHIPIIMMIFNILYLFILTLNYTVDMKQRLIAVMAMYSILFVVEMLVVAITGYIHFPLNGEEMYSSIFGQIANQLIGLILVNILGDRKKVEKHTCLPFTYWFCIIIIPIFSLYFLVLIFHIGNLNEIHLILCICFLLIINCSIIFLYNIVIASMIGKTKGLLLEQQNKFYKQQLELMQVIMKKNNSLHHDLNGHLITLKTYLKEENVRETVEYIDKMINYDTNYENEFSKTGNTIVDSIFNLKYQEAIHKGISVNEKIQIPEELCIDDFDLTVILGNIFDNAIEAATKIKNNRKINILFIYDRRRLVFKVENTYDGKVNMERGKLISKKKEQDSHGIGLQNVKYAVDKYSGTVDINYNDEWFEISVMLYL